VSWHQKGHKRWSRHFDVAFDTFSSCLEEMGKGLDALEDRVSEPAEPAQRSNSSLIEAKSWRQRWRYFCRFHGLAWKMLFRGRVRIGLLSAPKVNPRSDSAVSGGKVAPLSRHGNN